MKTFYIVLSILFAGCLSAQVSLTSSLTACYALDGNTNEPINNLTGTVSAVTPTVNRLSQANSAMAFSGSPTSFIQLPNNPLIKPTGVSFSCWVKTNVANTTQYIVYTSNGCVNYFEGYTLLYYNTGINTTRFAIVRSTSACSAASQIVLSGNTTTITSNTWYHVGFYIGADSLKLFVNGVSDGTLANANPIVYGANKNVFLGGSNESVNYPLNGSIDNVRFYNRKLSGTEFNQLYTLDPSCAGTPVASFSYSPAVPCINQTISLTNLSVNSPTAYVWTMAGGTPSVSSVANPTVSYSTPGIYTISLVASNASGTSAPSTQTINVGSCLYASLSNSLTACYALNGNGSEPINNLTGTLSAVTPTVNRFSQANSAMAFNGTPSSFIQLPNNPLLKANAVSFSAWAKTNSTNTSQYVVFTTNGCMSYYEGYQMAFINLGPNAYRLQVVKSSAACSSTGQIVLNSTTNTLTANSWIHVGFYAGADSLKLYINGVLDAALANTNPLTYGATTNVYLGGTNQSPNLPFNGSLDNVRFYNRKLTGTEFNQLYTLDPICQPQPVASFTMSAPAPNVCIFSNISLTSTSTNSPTTYAWTMAGGTPSVSTSPNPFVAYGMTGTYTITLVASNGFGTSAPFSQTVNVSPCLGIDESTNGKTVTLYPNPAKNELYVSGLEKGTDISLFNMLGALVYKGRVESDIEKINLTTQSPGLYIMRFVSQGKMITTKVIKE